MTRVLSRSSQIRSADGLAEPHRLSSQTWGRCRSPCGVGLFFSIGQHDTFADTSPRKSRANEADQGCASARAALDESKDPADLRKRVREAHTADAASLIDRISGAAEFLYVVFLIIAAGVLCAVISKARRLG